MNLQFINLFFQKGESTKLSYKPVNLYISMKKQKQSNKEPNSLQKSQSETQGQLSQRKLNVGGKIFRTLEILHIVKLRHSFYKLAFVTLKKSQKYLKAKSEELINSLHRIFVIKIKQYQETFIQSCKFRMHKTKATNNSNRLQIQQAHQKKLSHIQMIKNIRSNRINIKNKMDEKKGKIQQSLKELVTKLKNIQNSILLHGFYKIKTYSLNSLINKKVTYLWHHLSSKRRYWLFFGFQKLKCNILLDRGAKSVEQITHLDTKLAPMQDAELESIKQKQNKLKTALQNVNAEREKIQEEINKELKSYKQQTFQKSEKIEVLKQKKEQFTLQLNKYQNLSKHPLVQQEIYYYAYLNFLINVKIFELYFPQQALNKSTVLQWLEQLALPLPQIQNNCNADVINWNNDLLKQYKRLSSKQSPNSNEILSQNFMRSQKSYENLLKENKYMYKALSCLIQRTSEVANHYVKKISQSYQKLNGQTKQVI